MADDHQQMQRILFGRINGVLEGSDRLPAMGALMDYFVAQLCISHPSIQSAGDAVDSAATQMKLQIINNWEAYKSLRSQQEFAAEKANLGFTGAAKK